MSDEVSWGLSQNHFLAPSLAGFKGKRETGPLETCIEVSWSATERCCALDSGSDLGMWKDRSQPTLRLESQPFSSLASSLVSILWFRNLTAVTFVHPRATLWTQGPAQHEG